MYIYISIYVYACMYGCMRVCMYVCMVASMHVCVCAGVSLCVLVFQLQLHMNKHNLHVCLSVAQSVKGNTCKHLV